jgi:hypothetical protein
MSFKDSASRGANGTPIVYLNGVESQLRDSSTGNRHSTFIQQIMNPLE